MTDKQLQPPLEAPPTEEQRTGYCDSATISRELARRPTVSPPISLIPHPVHLPSPQDPLSDVDNADDGPASEDDGASDGRFVYENAFYESDSEPNREESLQLAVVLPSGGDEPKGPQPEQAQHSLVALGPSYMHRRAYQVAVAQLDADLDKWQELEKQLEALQAKNPARSVAAREAEGMAVYNQEAERKEMPSLPTVRDYASASAEIDKTFACMEECLERMARKKTLFPKEMPLVGPNAGTRPEAK